MEVEGKIYAMRYVENILKAGADKDKLIQIIDSIYDDGFTDGQNELQSDCNEGHDDLRMDLD